MIGKTSPVLSVRLRLKESPWEEEGLIFAQSARNRMKKRIQTNGIIIFTCLLLVIAFPGKFLRLRSALGDHLIEVLGMALMLFGLLLRVSSRGFKAEYSQGGNHLVIGGPYVLVRNPMYLGIFCIAMGVILSLFQWWVLPIFIVFFVSRYITLIYKEEKLLMQNFGRQYADYQNKIPRLFPQFSILLNRKVLNYLPLKLSWVKKELSSIFILLLGTLTVEYWSETRPFKLSSLLHFISLLGVIGLFICFSLFLSKHYEGIPK